MATPTPKRPQTSPVTRDRSFQKNPQSTVEIVDPVWMMKAIGVAVLAALFCGYASLCLLFYQGQWQLVLHPSRSKPAPPGIGGSPFQIIHFGVDESAVPQLAGWWIPAAGGARYASYTLFYLPSGDGSLVDAAPTLAEIHAIGINIFAFDYRGYGQSAPARPSQRRMTEDAASAWQYLTVSRSLSVDRIIPFGDGVGCALAINLALTHPQMPAVILQSPVPDLLHGVLADPRTRLLPVHALFHDRFEIAGSLNSLRTPKLFLLPVSSTGSIPHAVQQLAVQATPPKVIANLPAQAIAEPLFEEQISRFLDKYVH